MNDTPRRPMNRLQILLLLGGLSLILALLLRQTPVPRITVHNVTQLHEIRALQSGMEGYPPRHFALSPEGDRLAVTAGYSNELWGLRDGSKHEMNLKDAGGHSPLVFFADQRPLAAFENWGTSLIFLDLETGAPIQRFEHNTVVEWDVSPDGRWVASNYDEYRLYVADVLTGERRFTLTPPGGYLVRNTNPTFNQDCSILATTLKKGDGGFIWDTFLWDAVTGDLLGQLGTFSDEGTPWSIAFSHDGKTLALGGLYHIDSRLRSWFQLWNLETGTEIAAWSGEGGAVYHVQFTADDRYLVANGNNDIWLWDVAAPDPTPALVLFLEGNGSTQRYDTMAVSQDGRLLAVGGLGSLILLYDVASGQELVRLRGHKNTVRQLSFSHDGRLLVSSGADGAVRFWSIGDYDPYPDWEAQSATPLATPVMTPTIPG